MAVVVVAGVPAAGEIGHLIREERNSPWRKTVCGQINGVDAGGGCARGEEV